MTLDLARSALAARGGAGPITPLASGMSSQAWVATIGGIEFVIRTPVAGDRRPDPDYHREARLNSALRRAGVPVPEIEVVEIGDVQCSLARRVAGNPVRPGDWTDAFASDVADALAATHSITPAAHDLLSAVERFHLARLWPIDGTSIDDHPVTTRLPDAVERVQIRADEICREASRTPVVVHTDLHWDHLRRSHDGRLAGVLDFGDAFAGPPAWDFACLRYYHGDEVARRVASHYPDGAETLRRAETLGIAFALYKLDKTPDRSDVIERVRRFT